MATNSPPSLQQFLDDTSFPLAKGDLVQRARDEGVSGDAIAMLELLPDQTYMTSTDVSLATSQLDVGATSEPAPKPRRRRQVAVGPGPSGAGEDEPTPSRAPSSRRRGAAKSDAGTDVSTPSTSTKTATEEATKRLASRVSGVAKEQLESRKTEATAQLAQATSSLRQSGQQLREQGNATLADVADVAASGLEQATSYLRDRDVESLVRTVDSAARRQPLLVIGGGFLAAFLVTRALKAGIGGPPGQERPKNQNER